jgi:hypothetical protein
MSEHAVTFERRFQGIPDVALGGYVGGLLAGERESGEVVLRRPVPLDRELRLERSDDGAARLFEGAEKLAEWRPTALEMDVPAVTLAEAMAAEALSLQRSPEFDHPFKSCMTCGPSRAPGDGLRIFAGPVAGRAVAAATWTPERSHAGPDGAVLPALVWASLDCPTIMAAVFASPTDAREAVVTARFAVTRRGQMRAGAPHVVVGWDVGREGKAYIAGGAVLNADGTVLAIARHTLVPVSWGVPLGTDTWRRAA